jgi:hypothetical protein
MQWSRHLSLQAAPYANVVKEWFKLPGWAQATRQVFPLPWRGIKKNQQNQALFAGTAAAKHSPTDQKGSVRHG